MYNEEKINFKLDKGLVVLSKGLSFLKAGKLYIIIIYLKIDFRYRLTALRSSVDVASCSRPGRILVKAGLYAIVLAEAKVILSRSSIHICDQQESMYI